MSAAFPAAVGPMLLAALTLIALLIPPLRPTVRDLDPVDGDEPARPDSCAGNAEGNSGARCWFGWLVGVPDWSSAFQPRPAHSGKGFGQLKTLSARSGQIVTTALRSWVLGVGERTPETRHAHG